MNTEANRQLAESLNVAEEVLPYLHELLQVFANFVKKEKDECEVIETSTEEAIWLLQKS